QELEQRLAALFQALNQSGHQFDSALIFNRINQYYFTGTMQDGVLVLRKDGSVVHFVRKSAERAKLESPLDLVYPISSYRDLLAKLPVELGSTFIEMETVPLATLERLKKYFNFAAIHPLDGIISRLRMVKSPYELDLIQESGRQHRQLMEQVVPQLLKPGISEVEFLADLYASMVKLGHHGVSRFSVLQLEMIAGQVGFGDSSIYPTNFNGPGGMLGMSPAVPLVGNPNRHLKKGDLVFVDIGYGVQGYHSDKTQIYSFGAPPDAEAVKIHQACIDVLNRTAGQLLVGAIPADIYRTVMADLPAALGENFMGFGQERVQFLGHGVGLHIDEPPVIARGFNVPLQANMVLAIEPKCGIAGRGMVGAEETFVVMPSGPVCLTGGAREIITV
ncbi:MAG: peptidase, partial [Firmicutes bacterium]|nr:peptidase [Bacillota bacterium]